MRINTEVGAITYARSLWHTWFDRDYSLAGEVVLRAGDALTRRLIDVSKPVLYLPSLAIHLQDSDNPFQYNKEDDFRLIFETTPEEELAEECNVQCPRYDEEEDPRSIVDQHHANFLKLVAGAAHTTPEQIVDMDLYVYDYNQTRISGIHQDFITGARLDDLVGTYTAVHALLRSIEDEDCVKCEEGIRIVACFDSENAGSKTEMGAKSAFFEHVLRRISANCDPVAFERACGRSMLVAVNQFDATHPNYPSKSEIATGRNDHRESKTIGPILAASLGILTADVGCPQLAMNSVRELMGTKCIEESIDLYTVTKAIEISPSTTCNFYSLPDVLR
ncbi:aminopeptidase I zinc metalloprotease [Teladorsagia circumcincta]|uniref:aspartyl aminopeptidase n=1 Tax=Teladorsagia circumcincta TaxID=45464 RepID=A0A2G9V6V0_TELCI|nr:aminopeptidase I zinc metalloprotease [Teladorsagia circumcincta]